MSRRFETELANESEHANEPKLANEPELVNEPELANEPELVIASTLKKYIVILVSNVPFLFKYTQKEWI